MSNKTSLTSSSTSSKDVKVRTSENCKKARPLILRLISYILVIVISVATTILFVKYNYHSIPIIIAIILLLVACTLQFLFFIRYDNGRLKNTPSQKEDKKLRYKLSRANKITIAFNLLVVVATFFISSPALDRFKDNAEWVYPAIISGILAVFLFVDGLIYTHYNSDTSHFVFEKKAGQKYKLSFQIMEELRKEMIIKARKDKTADKTLDNTLWAPLDYAKQLFAGNVPPTFNPDDLYIESLYDPTLRLIIAITAEDLNLWLDPTFDFYMANCYASTLCHKYNNISNSKFNSIISQNWTDCNPGLEKMNVLKDIGDIGNTIYGNFQFLRFFILKKDVIEKCKETILPSLESSQNLFGIYSYYLKHEKINSKIEELHSNIWDSIGANKSSTIQDGYKKCIDDRKRDVLPEFLFLIKENNIALHTYLKGEPYFISIDKEEQEESLYNTICAFINMIIQLSKDDSNMYSIKPAYRNKYHTMIKPVMNDELIAAE